MSVLVLSAHPDDEALGCGATIHKLSKSRRVCVVTFTDGGGARPGGASRSSELHVSASKLGFEVLGTLAFPDNQMDSVPLLSVNQTLEDILVRENFTPDLILTHNPWCLNIDHRRVFESTQVISRMMKCKVMCYEVPSSSEWNAVSEFRSNCYVELSDEDVDAKIDALQTAYAGELRSGYHPRSVESILTSMRLNGSVIGVKYAERFMSIREVL